MNRKQALELLNQHKAQVVAWLGISREVLSRQNIEAVFQAIVNANHDPG